MLLLVRDRHNKAVQCAVDTLLEKKPFISARMVVDMYLYPRASKVRAAASTSSTHTLPLLSFIQHTHHSPTLHAYNNTTHKKPNSHRLSRSLLPRPRRPACPSR